MKQAVSQRQVRRKARWRIPLYGLLTFLFIGPFLRSSSRMLQSSFILWLGLIALVVWKLIKWVRALKVADLFPRYVHGLDTTLSRRTADLAARLGQPQEQVIRNVKAMSRLGLLPEVAITRDGEFALMGADHQPLAQWQQEIRLREEVAMVRARAEREREEADLLREALRERASRSARCLGCGAPVKVTQGRPAPCPYCGTWM